MGYTSLFAIVRLLKWQRVPDGQPYIDLTYIYEGVGVGSRSTPWMMNRHILGILTVGIVNGEQSMKDTFIDLHGKQFHLAPIWLFLSKGVLQP